MGGSHGGGGSQPVYSKEQRAIQQQFFDVFGPQIGEGAPAYGGNLWAGAAPIQQGLFQGYGGFDPSALIQGQQNVLTGAMTGTGMPDISPAAKEYFQTSVAAPAIQRFQEQILPGMTHAQAAEGTFGAGAAMRARERMGTDLATGLGQSEAQFAFQQQEAGRQRALQAAQQAGGMIGQAGQMGEQQRILGQAPLDIAYQQWQREQPSANPLNALLASLATSQYYMPTGGGGGGLFK